AALGDYLGSPDRVLDVGSADGPSVRWMRGEHWQTSLDLDPRGLRSGEGVCASALALPFKDESFDVVGAFDVVEHCEHESVALDELGRVLVRGGRLLLSVPAYQWAWTDHDIRAGHYRRYSKPAIVDAVQRAGLVVQRATYGFGAVFPVFMAERVIRRIRHHQTQQVNEIQHVPAAVERLLMGLTKVDVTVLKRGNLPFGSSVFLAATKPQ
ncbi:MAG: methyltransferase domain-containing protein, partial [Nocardioidaceae bacterium]